MIIEQVIEFELRVPWALWPYMYSYNWLFLCQNQKSLTKIFRVDYYLLLKYLQNLTPKCKLWT